MPNKNHLVDSLLYYGIWQIKPRAIVNWQSSDAVGTYVDTRVED